MYISRMDIKKLNKNHLKFCQELASGKSQMDSYKSAFKTCKKDETAKVNSSKLLTSTNLFQYYQSLLNQNAVKSEITRERILNEYAKIGFSSIANLHNSWIELKEFDKLSQDQKDSICEIQRQVKSIKNESGGCDEIEYVKIKLYDKLKALDSIKSMLGFDAPLKTENTNINIEPSVKFYIPNDGRNNE